MPDCGRGPIESQFNTEQFSGAPGIFAGEVTQVTLQGVNGHCKDHLGGRLEILWTWQA